MNVLIIPEDFRKDQYILKPVIAAMCKRLKMKNATIEVCQDLLGGVGEALKWKRIEEIIDKYKWQVNLFLLMVDRDGKEGRRQQLDQLEKRAGQRFPTITFLGENAWQEVEIFILAGSTLPRGWVWRDVRAEVSLKEEYYVEFARAQGVIEEPDEGRRTLAEQAARNYKTIRSRCPEDIQSLETRISANCL